VKQASSSFRGFKSKIKHKLVYGWCIFIFLRYLLLSFGLNCLSHRFLLSSRESTRLLGFRDPFNHFVCRLFKGDCIRVMGSYYVFFYELIHILLEILCFLFDLELERHLF
jgi:hypothetical protein